MEKAKKIQMKRLDFYVKNNGYTMEDKEFVEIARKMFIDTGRDPDKMMEIEITPFVCCVCGELIEDEFSNNARPYKDGECCARCNRKIKCLDE